GGNSGSAPLRSSDCPRVSWAATARTSAASQTARAVFPVRRRWVLESRLISIPSAGGRPSLLLAAGGQRVGGLNRFGGGGSRYAANPGLTPRFRRSLPETGCLSQGLPHGKRYAWPCPPKPLSTPASGTSPVAADHLRPGVQARGVIEKVLFLANLRQAL